tara:strand:- start:1634 stop:1864 length:231 start_codon:yes stop_codon:yes gene_type:complete
MDKLPTHIVAVNGLFAEVYDANPQEGFWGNKKVYIYDCLSDLADAEKDIIINYLYEEGFIDDRRTKCEVIRGEDYL